MLSEPKAIKLHSDARAELKESVDFYRERGGDRWAARFKEQIARGLRAIAANPERYPPAQDLPGVQKLRIDQFPFSLLYINRADYVWVIAVAHGKREPGYWRNRIS